LNGGIDMKSSSNIGIYGLLLTASIVFLIIEHLTHIEFLLHLAAIPLEVLVAVFIVERFLAMKERHERRRQFMFIKSYMFRSNMRSLFTSNFSALKSPAITFATIRSASLEELRQWRRQAEEIQYKSPEAMESVIMEYVKAQPVWMSFMERAITYNFEEIFHDMIYILHFISDVQAFKAAYPHDLFIAKAMRDEGMMVKVRKVLSDGIQRFLDYATELKEKQPTMFNDVLSDYELSSELVKSSGRETPDELIERRGK
jgi:hypothetical protein